MRLVGAAVMCLWVGQCAAALACAISCLPAGAASAVVEHAAPAREATHAHHGAAATAEAWASDRPADTVGAPPRHSCHEPSDPAVTAVTGATWRVDELIRLAAATSSGKLESVPTSARVVGRPHEDRRASPPPLTSQSVVRRI